MRYHLEQRARQGTNQFRADPFLLGAKTDSPDHLAASGVADDRLSINKDAVGEAARVMFELL